MEFFKLVMWPPSYGARLGRVVGALSMLGIIEKAFSVGLAPVFAQLLEFYDKFLGKIFGRLEPVIQIFLDFLSTHIGWQFTLEPHWKHIFVLMGIYFFRDAGIALKLGQKASGIYHSIVGLMIAFLSAIIAGSIPVGIADFWANVAVASVPIFGLLVYSVLGRAWGATFERRHDVPTGAPTPSWFTVFWGPVRNAVLRTVVGNAIVVLGVVTPMIAALNAPGLALLTVCIVLLALYWIWQGAVLAKKSGSEGPKFMPAFVDRAETQVGAAVLGVFGYICVFLLTNAGF